MRLKYIKLPFYFVSFLLKINKHISINIRKLVKLCDLMTYRNDHMDVEVKQYEAKINNANYYRKTNFLFTT